MQDDRNVMIVDDDAHVRIAVKISCLMPGFMSSLQTAGASVLSC